MTGSVGSWLEAFVECAEPETTRSCTGRGSSLETLTGSALEGVAKEIQEESSKEGDMADAKGLETEVIISGFHRTLREGESSMVAAWWV